MGGAVGGGRVGRGAGVAVRVIVGTTAVISPRMTASRVWFGVGCGKAVGAAGRSPRFTHAVTLSPGNTSARLARRRARTSLGRTSRVERAPKSPRPRWGEGGGASTAGANGLADLFVIPGHPPHPTPLPQGGGGAATSTPGAEPDEGSALSGSLVWHSALTRGRTAEVSERFGRSFGSGASPLSGLGVAESAVLAQPGADRRP